MSTIKNSIYVVSVIILFISCFEEDKKVNPYPGEVITIEEDIEFNQAYFDFETGEVVKYHPADVWELGFEAGKDGWHIIHNSGAGWFIWNSGQNSINDPMEYPQNTLWSYDIQSEYPESTSVGNWVTVQEEDTTYTGDVYLLGKVLSLNYISIKQIQFVHVDSSGYRFIYFDRDQGYTDTVDIVKSDSVNFVYYSFSERKQINPEPNKEIYDIMFGPYYDLATQLGVTLPYLVRGVLLNASNTSAVLDSISSYEQIDIHQINDYPFTDQRDIIGYRWKDVFIDPGSGSADYFVKRNYNYVIKTAQGNYYKFRFLSFNLDGVTGFPQFEFKDLSDQQ